MGYHVVSIESRFYRMASEASTIKESMKMAILLSSLSESTVYVAVIASVNTIPEHLTT